MRVGCSASAVVALVGFATLASGQPAVVRVFAGMNGPNGSTPQPSADMMGGVGPTHIVGFINGGVSIRTKSDGREVRPLQTQQEFWARAFENARRQLVGAPYDPRIFFDPLTGRWFATANAWGEGKGTNRTLIAVSADADPTHTWKALDYLAPAPLADNSKLGLDRNGFYTTPMVPAATSVENTFRLSVVAVPKVDLLWKGDGGPSLAHQQVFEIETVRLPDHKFRGEEGLFPAFDLDAKKKPNDPAVFVNRYRAEVDGETCIQIRKVTWTTPTAATLSDPISVGLGTHYPVQPTTRGIQPALPEGLYSPGLSTGEGRIVNAVVRHGSVWAIAATEIGNRVGAFWVQIDLSTMRLVQHGTLSDPEADVLFPSLNVDAQGNLGIAMTRTSASQALSVYVTGRLRTDPPNTLRPLVKAVEGRYVFFNARTDLTKPGQTVPTSDYATTVVDPSDQTLFWSYQFAATNDCLPKDTNTGKFGTAWVAFRVGPAPRGGGR